MFRTAGTVLWSVLNKPLFGTRAIPRDAAVDPTLFSEDEYPVHCPKCGYLLRGLPDGRCPECGTPFERGRLLVQQYVREWGGASWKHSRAGKWCTWLFIIGFALPILGGLGFASMYYLVIQGPPSGASFSTLDWALSLAYVLVGTIYVGFLLMFLAAAITIKAYQRGARRRRRAVVNALREGAD